MRPLNGRFVYEEFCKPCHFLAAHLRLNGSNRRKKMTRKIVPLQRERESVNFMGMGFFISLEHCLHHLMRSLRLALRLLRSSDEKPDAVLCLAAVTLRQYQAW